jgi:hypothetical protein
MSELTPSARAEIERNISLLESRARQLRSDLAAAEKDLFEERCKLAGCKIGDVVRATDGPWKGHLFQICDIQPVPAADGRLQVCGHPKRSDGAFALTRRYLYGDWELATDPIF